MNPSANPARSPRIAAFTSSTRGVGRTCALANVACVLASAGHRPLIIDNGTDDPRVHAYLRPFLADGEPAGEAAALTRSLLALPARTPLAGNRYRLPIPGTAPIDSIALDGAQAAPSRTSALEPGLRERVRAAGYDYILLDVSAGASAEMTKRLAYLCDTVAVCFHPRASDVDHAGAIARALSAQVPFSLDVVAIVLQIDDQDSAVARNIRDHVHARFEEAGGPDVTISVAEIPYHPMGMLSDHAVAVLYEEPGAELAEAYVAVADRVTLGRVRRMTALPARARDGYRYSLGMSRREAPPRIFLSYAAEHRLWADWISDVLTSGGARVAPLPHNPSPPAATGPFSVLRIVHRGLPAVPAADATDAEVVTVRVDDGPEPVLIDLRGRKAEQARRGLLRHFGLFERPEGDPGRARELYPGDPVRRPGRSVLPPRDDRFGGREAELGEVRDRLRAGTRVVTCRLDGEAGAGKSAVALEYAHRFTTDYDLVWWIPAEDERSIRAALSALATELGLSGADKQGAALEALGSPERFRRWLLVYDNVPDPAGLTALVPGHEHGHVIVTTRTPSSSAVHIGRLSQDEGAALLVRLVTGLPPEHAARIAGLADRLPLALRLVAAWLSATAAKIRPQVTSGEAAARWAADEFTARCGLPRHEAADGLAGSLGTTIGLITDSLAEDDLGRVALRLAQLCSWLSPDGVALRFLRSPALIRALAEVAKEPEALVLDPLELDQVLHRGEQYELFRMNWESPERLSMIRPVQRLLRAAQPPDEAQACRRAVLSALAAFAPTSPEPEAPQDLADFAELQHHLQPAGAAGSPDVTVRRWLVDQVNYLIRLPDKESARQAVELGEAVLAGWMPETRAESSLRMRLEFQLTNLRRAAGEDARLLLAWDNGLLEGQQELLGPDHPRTLKTWRSRGANLRGIGRFADSCAAEQKTLAGFRDRLGEFHPDTRRAATNLAYAYLLTGDVGSAVTLERRNRDIRLALFGDDHPDVWVSACNLGVYLREQGEYAEAEAVLNEALQHVIAMAGPGGDPAQELRIRWHRAILLRQRGRFDSAFEENRETRRRMRRLLGTADPRTAGCTLSFAIDYHFKHDTETAIELLEESRRAFPSSDSRHVYTTLHRLNLAVLTREGTAEVSAELADWLGEDHPWSLAGKINHANALASGGAVGEADALLAEVHDECLDYLPENHPYTALVAGNLAASPSERKDIHVDLPF